MKNEIIEQLEALYNPVNIEGMKRFGIESEKIFGITMKDLEQFKKTIGKNHQLALELWDEGYHETRMLAAMIADPKLMTPEILNQWAGDFDNWAVCDSVCGKLFQKVPGIYDNVIEWQYNENLWVKRASFALIAWISVHHKKLPDSFFNQYLEMIVEHSTDDRPYIKKAVNWALRQIGKRNLNLAHQALEVCSLLKNQEPVSKSARWIASDAERELRKKYLL
jgi:3-methyladenine DNA glycosylase AlkD